MSSEILQNPMELPPRKRGRQAEACLPCRNRKIKCDRTQPICNRCTRSRGNIHCVYEGEPTYKKIETAIPTFGIESNDNSASPKKQELPAFQRSKLQPDSQSGAVKADILLPSRSRGRGTKTRSVGTGIFSILISQVSPSQINSDIEAVAQTSHNSIQISKLSRDLLLPLIQFS